MSFFGNRRQAEPVHEPTPQRPELPQPPSTAQTPVGFETVLGANSTLEGTLRSSANIRLDGTFTGTLEITGNVLVGETARITADIDAKNISIAGAVRGNISGKKVQLLRTGRVWGDIRAAALTTEEGAFIDGKITMASPENMTPPGARGDNPGSSGGPGSGGGRTGGPEGHESHGGRSTEGQTGPSQGEDYDRLIEGVQPIGMGATEEDPDDMIHEPGEPPSGYQGNPLIENISQDDPEVQNVQTDSEEGQAYTPVDDESPETKQST